jgi:hypothetical protein
MKQDVIGKKFGRLTVLDKFNERPKKHLIAKVTAMCECGSVKTYYWGTVKNGSGKGCGCHPDDKKRKPRKHGLTDHLVHQLWRRIKARCYNPKTEMYSYYGGRGITMCPEWLNNFQAFYDWAMLNGWEKGLEIDRIDNDGHYAPNNCRFVTKKQNGANKRNNIVIEYNGEKKILHDWAVELGINYQTLHNRIHNYGMTVEEAFVQGRARRRYISKKRGILNTK